MQYHTVQQIEHGPRAGRWVYTTGGADEGRRPQCCADAWARMLDTRPDEHESSPAWAHIGHDTPQQAYNHMREVLLGRLQLEVRLSDWSGCRAPQGGGIVCDVPTRRSAEIPPCHFAAALCDKHRTRGQVEAMWDGPGDWSGSW